ncbi:MAG: InlB B-repeat-containing protein [Bacteroidales bacterium]
MKKTIPWALTWFMALMLVFSVNSWGQTVITQWDFNDDTLIPAVGSGTALNIGGTSSAYAAGITGNPDRGWNLSAFPEQGALSGTAGAEFMVSTVGFENITLQFFHRASGTGSRWAEIHYTTDGGTTWNVQGNNNGGLSPHDIFYEFNVDFSSIPAVNDNPNFGIRIVSIFSPLAFNQNATLSYEANEAYMRSNAQATYPPVPGEGTGNYGAAGTWRFDDVTFSGEVIAEEPGFDFSESFSELFTFSLANGNTPDWLTGTNNRGLAVHGDNLYAANLGGNLIRVLNPQTGELKNSITLTGVIGGLQALATCDLEVDAEGAILIGNVAQDATEGTPQVFRVYSVNGSTATLVLSFPIPEGDGRLGDKFTLRGKLSDKSAVLYAVDGKVGKTRIFRFTMLPDPTDNILFGAPEVITLGTATGGSAKVAPIPGGGYYFTGNGVGVSRLNADGSLVGTIPTTIIAGGSTSLEFVAKDGDDHIIAVYDRGPNSERVRLVRVINGDPSNVNIFYSSPIMNNTATNHNVNGTGDIAVLNKGEGVFNVYVLGSTVGIGGYTNEEVEEPTYTVTFTVADEDGVAITDAVITFDGVENAAGVYVFEDLEAGDYPYTVAAEGFLDATGTVSVVDQDVAVAVVLLPVPPTYTVTFVVEDEEGDAIANAVVTLNGVANAAGNYVFADVLAGTYAYTVVAAGFEDAAGNVEVVDEDLTVTVVMLEETVPPGSDCANPIVVDVYDAPLVDFVISSENFPNTFTPAMSNPSENYLGGNNIVFQFTLTSSSYVSGSVAGSWAGLMIYGTCPSLETPALRLARAAGASGGSFSNVILEAGDYFAIAGTWPAPQFTSMTINLSALAITAEPTLTVNPAALAVGHAVANLTSVTRNLIVGNNGLADLIIEEADVVIGGADADLFSVALANAELEFPVTIEFGQTVAMAVTFTPTAEGPAEATLTLGSNSPNDDVVVPLTGTGYLPFTFVFENFDAALPPAIPSPWSGIAQSPGTGFFSDVVTAGNPNSAPHHVRLAIGNNLAAQVFLVSPMVTNLEESWVRFFGKMSLSTAVETLEVGFLTDNTDPSTFTVVQSVTLDGTYKAFSVSFADADGITFPENAYIGFRNASAVTARTMYLDDITYEEQPTVPVFSVNKDEINFGNLVWIGETKTETLTVSNAGAGVLTLNEVDFTITGDDADIFSLIFPAGTEWPVELESSELFTFSVVFAPEAAIAYNAVLEIEDNIGTKAVNTVTLTGTGYDATLTPAFVFDFIGTFPPLDWRRYNGELTEASDLVIGSTIWSHGKFGGNQSLPANNSARINVWGNERSAWLVTPPIDLGDGSDDYMLTFDLALTAWNTSNPSNFGPEQYFAVVISTDDGQTWSSENTLRLWNNTTPISNLGEPVFIDLSEYSGKVRIGFYGHSRPGGGDVDVFVTNVGVKDAEFFTVTFNVEDEDGVAIDNAIISLGEVTNLAGEYVFADVFPGNYNYTVTADGFVPFTFTNLLVTEDLTIDVVLEEPFALTLLVNPEGWGVVTGAGDYPAGAEVSVTATANAGYEFLNWTNEAGAVVSTQADNVITMPAEDLTLIANFIVGPADALPMATLFDKTGPNKPTQIGDGGNARAAALYQDRYVIVPSREGAVNVWVWDVLNPHLPPVALDLGDGIIVGGLFAVNYVHTVGDDIYVSNMSLGSNADHPFRVYRWSGLDATPEVVLSADGGFGRLGDAFSILGDPAADGSIIAHVNSGGEGQRIFRKWNYVDGVLQNLDTPETITLEGTFNVNSFGVINVIEDEDDLFLATGNGMGIAIVNLDGEVQAYVGIDVFPTRVMDPNIFYYNGNRYLSYVVNKEWEAADGAYYQIVDITEGATVVEALSYLNSPEALANRIAHSFVIGGGAAFLSGTNRVYHVDDEILVLSHVVARGFVLETTGTLPATYTLTVEAQPAAGGTVTGGGDYYEGATVPVTATPASGYQFVNWTVGANEVSTAASFNFTMPGAATTLVANFETIPVVDVATLAELRTKPADGTLYRYTGNAVIVAKDSFRNRKFLQDATAAIQIDDQPGVITTPYDLYDEITNVVGRINIFNNMVRFQPQANTDPSTQNTPVDPTIFAIDELTSADQAKLIKLVNVTFQNLTEGQVFANGTNYVISDGENEMTLRTDFWNVDYIGEEIPDHALNITGVIIQFQDAFQIVPRFAADFEDYVETFAVTFNVDMTPATGFDPASDVVYMTGSMFGWAAPGDQPENQTMTRVDQTMIWTKTLQLEAGTYQYKYFMNAGWTGGEWDGAPDRVVVVDGAMVVNNVWRDLVNVNNFDPLVLNLFPNPARDIFNIHAEAMIRNVVIADLTGKIVYSDVINDTQTQIRNTFEAGMYIVRIYTDEGVFVRKLQIR